MVAKKIIIVIVILLIGLFSFIGCGTTLNNSNGQKTTGFEARVNFLGEYTKDTYGVITFYKQYQYQVMTNGYMSPDAVYTLKVQVGFYADNVNVKTVEHTFTCHGQEDCAETYLVSISKELCENKTVTAKIVKISWE